ncbi:MAG: flagellin [Cupriavidus necator]
MAQVINTNSLSLMTQNNLNTSQSQLNTAIQRLSSGLRINSAKDDAAGQAIANRFTANIKGLTQAQRNANDGISLAQTTEGALTEVTNNLQRVRELSVQAANGSNSASDLQSIQDEITQRLGEIDRISGQTDFNGVKVLSSSAKSLTVQVGANDGETISIDLKEISSKTLGLTGFNVSGTGMKNTKASADDLVLAGYAKGAVQANGNTAYTKTTANTAATSANLFGKVANGDTVADAAITYTYDSTKGTFGFAESNRALATVAAELKPSMGSTISAKVTIGGQSQDVKIDGNGAITAADDGAALYLDATGNLTKNNAAGDPAATVANLTASLDAGAAGNSIAVGSKVYTFDGAASGNVDVAGDEISNAALQTKLAGIAKTVVLGGTSYSVAAGGAVTTTIGANPVLVDTKGALTTSANTAETLYVSAEGQVNDDKGSVVYKDSANAGKFTTSATSNVTATADPLKALDAALSTVDKLRSSLGAVQNRFDSTIANLGTTINNLSSSRSRIQDADYATEVSNMTRAQILQQAGTSVLAQANQTTQNVLSLLR